jgi:hypothetical protein
MQYPKQEKKLLVRLMRYPGLINLLKHTRAMVCGGAINSVFSKRKICDYDIYFRNQTDCTEFQKGLLELHYKDTDLLAFESINETANASTYKCQIRPKMIVQVISAPEMFKDCPDGVFQLFDYTVCMGAYDFAINDFILHEKFLEDIEKKKLTFNAGTLFPICSLYRSIKYQRRGYRLTGVSTITMSLAIQALQMKNYHDLKRQLMGIDTLILKDLTDKWSTGELADKEYDAQEAIKIIEDYLAEKLGDKDVEAEDLDF